MCQISSGLVYSIALTDKAPNFPHFQLWHSVVAPPSGIETKLNVDAQLQTFPYPTISKPLLSSNAFWVMSSQTMLFKSMTDKLTDKKNQHFWLPGGVQSPSPTRFGRVIEDLEHVHKPLKQLGPDA